MKTPILSLLFACLALHMQAATWHVSPSGNDANDGSVGAPLLTLSAAVDLAAPGDEILLRQGTHSSAEVRITKNDLTIRSYPGEWARIVAITSDDNIASCIWYSEPDVTGGTLENLEIIGGYYYGVSFETNWDWGVPPQNRHGASNITLRNLRIHDTGRDCIKIKPGCDNIQILSCELYNSGVGPGNDPLDPNAEGIDNVNGDGMVVRNCHIHHTSTSGLYAKGGADGCIIEENLIRETGEAGILLGFYTDADYFDTAANPDYWECRNSIARNNIVINTGGAGIGFFGAQNCSAYNNTVVSACTQYHSPLFFSAGDIWISSSQTLNPANENVQAFNNIFIDQSPAADYTVEVRPNALIGTPQIHHNLYYKTTGPAVFDDGVNWPAHSFAQWQSVTGHDASSAEVDPQLDGQHHLSAGSPAIDAGQAGASTDYDGDTRSNTSDIGADEHNASTALVTPPPAGVIGTGLNGFIMAVQNRLESISFSAFPNPAMDWIQVEGLHQSATLQLTDSQGRLVRTTNGTRMTVADLPAGTYLLRLKTSQGVGVHTVVVAH